LKTIELHIKPTLDSQIESSEYEGWCQVVKRHQSDTRVSIVDLGDRSRGQTDEPGEDLPREPAQDLVPEAKGFTFHRLAGVLQSTKVMHE
jgi:hypothetical protein